MDFQNMKALVLAAGKGTRFKDDGPPIPKVLREALSRPLLDYVLTSLSFLPEKDVAVVVGFSKEAVLTFLQKRGAYAFTVQETQRGTGDAVRAAASLLSAFRGPLLVTAGDMPLIKADTYKALLRAHLNEKNACTLLTAETEDPAGYGRILRYEDGRFQAIREHADCSSSELLIKEINTSVYVFDSVPLFEALLKLTPENAQGEYYLTDVPEIFLKKGLPVGVYKTPNFRETLGVNTPAQLKEAEDILASRFS